ncbi:MupG family TIM beta-alpha barrel fold protein [Curtobacterium sp. PhB136]|uniref:MupG family TIM beta-alpha barrel fold protein n=1 Tax=Curtobacterium sp. PhB136 TaxID=2485181 RepID=UPI00104B9782|nr:MupG family TIM beta-alpha barrel fold protein [Curtobacterium sp. PhB136]TCK63122.1 phage integrase family protein [Curtobacterium sp. PhB136]
MRLGASAYLAHASLAGPTFSAAAEAGATLAFTSLHIPEDSADKARAAAAANVSAATSSGLAVVADVSPNSARLLGDSPWGFLRSIGVARVRIDFGFSVAEIRSIAAVLPIALNASTLQAADLEPYIAPSAGKLTVGMLGVQWIEAYKPTVKASQFHSEESSWRIHVEPKWGDRPVGSLAHTEIQGWISDLTTRYSANQVRRVHGVLKKILDGAVKDRRLMFNPALEIRLPKKLKGKHAYLSHEQVEQLASTSKYPDLIRFLAYTGLRWGEATGLRVKHVDRELRRVLVEENAVSVNGKIVVGTPKSHERRSVAYPSFLDAAFEATCAGKASDDLVWGNGYEHMRPGDSRRGWFVGAVKRMQATSAAAVSEAKLRGQKTPPLFPWITPHDLRHTAASLAISAGANVKALQRMLGHASAAMTLDTYTDLFEDDLDDVAAALDAARMRRLGQAVDAA